jgi:formylmethanofuran dehydrogenase subunit C
LAGTIVLGGHAAAGAGAAMRRGSVIALGGFARIAPTFADCGVHDLLIMRLLAAALAGLGLAALAARLGPLRRLVGDLAVDGKGELMMPG